MEHTGIIAGVIFGLLIFAFKAGIGIAYRLSIMTSNSKKYFIIVSSTAYLMLFIAISYLVQKIDVTVYIGKLLPMLRTGTTIHIVLCVSMAAWGIYLLSRRNMGQRFMVSNCGPIVSVSAFDLKHGVASSTSLHAQTSTDTWAWLTLALPCPVCMTVILFSMSFLHAIFSEHLLLITSGLYLFFIITVFLTAYGFHLLKDVKTPPEVLLAHLMLGVSGYFLLLLVISPQIQGITDIYDMVARRHASITDTPVSISLNIINVSGILTLLASAVTGFLIQRNKIQKAVMK